MGRYFFSSIALLIACGSEAPPGEAPSTNEQPPPAEQAAPVFDVHEWGLIDTNMDSDAVELAAGPGLARGEIGSSPLDDVLREGAVIGKPVLYFHPLEGTATFELQVQVRLGEGWRIAEHFPDGILSDAERTLRWGAQIQNSPCRNPRTYPNREDAACDTRDHYCEAAELAEYESGDGACVQVGESEWPLLFYRGGRANPAAGVRLPLRVSRQEDGVVRVGRESDAQPLGRLWRVSSNAGVVHVSAADWPANGASVDVPVPTDRAQLGEARDMAPALVEHGLTSAEALAFARAWHRELFGSGNSPISGVAGRYQTVPAPLPDVLLYWLPAVSISEAAALEFDPPARSVHRAMLVRVDLSRRD